MRIVLLLALAGCAPLEPEAADLAAPPADLAAPAVDLAADLAPFDIATADLAAADLAVPGLGALGGSCGMVAPLLHDPKPSHLRNALAFMAPEMYARDALSPDGRRLFDAPNAGGSSGESEVMSFEVLRRCEGATLAKTETEILYAPPDDAGPSTITDVLVKIAGERVGVSVTRVYKPSGQGALTDGEVKTILEGKLRGIVRSSMRVLPPDRWVKQVLHVFVIDGPAAQAIDRVLPTIDAGARADTIVLVTVTRGGGFLYCNPDPPLGMECPP